MAQEDGPNYPAKADVKQLYNILLSELTEFVVVMIDVEGRFASWNPGVEANLGYSKDEFIGQPFSMVFTPEDNAEGAAQKEIVRAAEQGRSADVRWHVRKDGRRLFVDGVIVALRGPGGDLLGFSKVMRDITERKCREDQLEELARALNHAQVMLRSLDGIIKFWSAGAERLYGYSREEALGRRAHELLQTEFPQRLEEIEGALLDSGIWNGELRQICKEGNAVTVASEWVLHRHAHNHPGLVMEASTDITGLKAIEEKLLEANDELQHFTYAATHDLQEPLRTIRAYSELILNRHAASLTNEVESLLRPIYNSATRMDNLIQSLLTYSQTGEAVVSEANANEALDTALLNLRTKIAETQAEITADTLPAVRADPARLMQLFQNLISNSLKYRSAERPKIYVGARPEGKHWLFFVRDNGEGFDPEYAKRIFRPFERLHRRKIEGSGIGLAICKRVIESQGGSIWAESEPGKGSTFYFTLPREQ
ncbi:MAG: PAS domain S-box protein [Bryobacterales bacterium]|nr:PAS domain S-box protein [Bryobacterales bacterium]MBV9398636.1 PAS domain S-box protein [Bryobacterales bacterium]